MASFIFFTEYSRGPNEPTHRLDGDRIITTYPNGTQEDSFLFSSRTLAHPFFSNRGKVQPQEGTTPSPSSEPSPVVADAAESIAEPLAAGLFTSLTAE